MNKPYMILDGYIKGQNTYVQSSKLESFSALATVTHRPFYIGTIKGTDPFLGGDFLFMDRSC